MDNPATEAPSSGSLHADYDIASRIIRITGTGSWSVELLDRHGEELQRIVAMARANGRPVRVLSDLSAAAVQAADVTAGIERITTAVFGSRDRVAVVVASNLLKLQMRRIVQGARFETFASSSDAMAWLTLPDADGALVHGPIQRAPRRTVSLVATVTTSASSHAARIVNISTSGLLLHCRGTLQVNERLWIELPELGFTSGRVARARDEYAGVRFDRPVMMDRLRMI